MKTSLIISVIIFLTGCSEESRENENLLIESETMGYIEKLDDELDRVLNVDAVPEVIGQGYDWSEGPVWVEEHQFLLFSDIPSNIIYKWTEEEGVTPYLEPSGYTGSTERGGEVGSNGLIMGHDGELLLCQHGDRRIARMEAPLTQPSPDYTSLADNYQGMKFNSPNDLVQHSSGSIYFTDPP